MRIVPASAGAAVGRLVPYSAHVTYNLNGRSGRAVLTLQVSHPGKFQVVARVASPETWSRWAK